MNTRLKRIEKSTTQRKRTQQQQNYTDVQIDYSLRLLEKLTRQNLLVATGESVWTEIQAQFLFGERIGENEHETS